MEGKSSWSVVDGVKTMIPPISPESLMKEINDAVSALEQARADSLIGSPSSSATSPPSSSSNGSIGMYDPQIADEAYKYGCAAVESGKLWEGLQSLNFSLAKCPPDRTSAVAKLRSIISLTSQQLLRSSKSRD